MNWDPELDLMEPQAGPCLMLAGALSLLEAASCREAASAVGEGCSLKGPFQTLKQNLHGWGPGTIFNKCPR